MAAALLLAAAATLPGSAHALAMSRGVQSLPLSYPQCLARAHEALVAEGFNAAPSTGASFVHGFKGPHGAYVICSGAQAQQAEVNIVVATENSGDGGVPGQERVRLQQRMAGVVPPAQPAGPPSSPPVAASRCDWRTASTFIEKGEANAWTAVYRRLNGNEFEATYTSPGDTRRSWLRMTFESPTVLRIDRHRTERTDWVGWMGATIQADGSRADGMYGGGNRFSLHCAASAGATAAAGAPYVIPATNAAPALNLGSVWREVEETEHAVWTRRPGTQTFDAAWSNGRVRAVLHMALAGNQVTIKRTQSTDGYECLYTGTLVGNRASGTFGCNRFGGQKPWHATIEGLGVQQAGR
jgi:hypothetical protein